MCIGYIYVVCGDYRGYGNYILEKQDWKNGIKTTYWEYVNESVWMVPGTVSIDD